MDNKRRAVNALLLSGVLGAISKPLVSAGAVMNNQKAAKDEVVDRWFGVSANGKTNDRAALQKAIDSAVGKTLVITGPVQDRCGGIALEKQ